MIRHNENGDYICDRCNSACVGYFSNDWEKYAGEWKGLVLCIRCFQELAGKDFILVLQEKQLHKNHSDMTESTKRKIEERKGKIIGVPASVENTKDWCELDCIFGYQLAMEEMKERVRSKPLIVFNHAENKEPKP